MIITRFISPAASNDDVQAVWKEITSQQDEDPNDLTDIFPTFIAFLYSFWEMVVSVVVAVILGI